MSDIGFFGLKPTAKIFRSLQEIDRQFADFIGELDRKGGDTVSVAAKLASYFAHEGHVCLDLKALAGNELLFEDGTSLHCPQLDVWLQSLTQSCVVGEPGEFKPLILDQHHRLYLQRYWEYESRLASSLLQRTSRRPLALDQELIEQLSILFPEQPDQKETDWRRAAALIALRSSICIIAGGPGTGKTSTAVRILALISRCSKDPRPRIALAAPTGKAAARLKQAARHFSDSIDESFRLSDIAPIEAYTLHRLLGSIPGSTRFRYNQDNPLPYDVVVVDEASMIDLPLMAKLVTALAVDTRLILLGDKDQLSSVEPGAVFGDLSAVAEEAGYSAPFREELVSVASSDLPTKEECSTSAMADTFVALTRNYRFEASSGIGQLSRLVCHGDFSSCRDLLLGEKYSDVSWRSVASPLELRLLLAAWVPAVYARYLKASDAQEAFSLFESRRVLCAVKQGIYGSVAVNRLIEDILEQDGLIDRRGKWYRGQPVMVNQNDYALRLFNGDVGLIVGRSSGDRGELLQAQFPITEGSSRFISLARLPPHETAYANTVHKVQGSEFEQVLLILPPQPSQVLTRELIYTAVTRARTQLEIWSTLEIMEYAVSRKIERNSGLREVLKCHEATDLHLRATIAENGK